MTPSDDDAPTAGTVLSPERPLEATLPVDLQGALGRFLGVGRIETLHDWSTHLREQLDTDAITIDVLCTTDPPSPHRGTVNEETYHFECFYDAIILAALVEETVSLRTASPSGAVITGQTDGTRTLTVDPPTAVFSFGIDRHVSSPGSDGPSFQTGYESICPYVRAFVGEDTYRGWAERVPAPTVAMPLRGPTELATALVKE